MLKAKVIMYYGISSICGSKKDDNSSTKARRGNEDVVLQDSYTLSEGSIII